jgi:hypothetical protein
MPANSTPSLSSIIPALQPLRDVAPPCAGYNLSRFHHKVSGAWYNSEPEVQGPLVRATLRLWGNRYLLRDGDFRFRSRRGLRLTESPFCLKFNSAAIKLTKADNSLKISRSKSPISNLLPPLRDSRSIAQGLTLRAL